ncbi:AAA ATPase domain-containing protein [Zopfochytrium polystomum]|nr:AAA ATPase domain-containing protein [Zopfochytrium polystomum]
MDSNHAIGDVSIGVAFGSVYAGLLGNELRMDGTVLGAAVNLAARLMCLDQPTANEDHVGGEGGGVWAYCDVATYEACQDRFKFGEASRVVKLKGFHQSITVYNLVGEKVSGIVARNSVVRHDLFGRVEEVALLKRVIQKWKQGEPRQSILISGRSGLGKSALTHQALRQLRGDTSAIICSCVAQEMKRQSSFWLLGSFLRTLISQLQSAGIEPSPIERGCSASEVSATSNRRHSIASSALTGPLCRRSEMHATGTANSGTVGSIFTTSGADRASTFLIEAVTRIERGALPALAIVPGFRFAAETSRPTADCTLTLSSVVAQLLAAAEKLSSRILIVLDDTQWIDRESLRVFGMLMQLCPLILFVMVARPREEWDHRDDFDTIKTRCEHLITLSPLSSDALHALVAQELGRANAKEGIIGEIAEWSNGIPMAVHLALSMIKSHNSGGPLEQANLLKSQTLKKLDSSQARLETAVTAQLDSLSAAFRQVLLVASVIGQYFSLNTLSCVLQDVEMPSEPDDFSVSQITHLIKTEDRYGFLAGVSDDEDSCSFSHYLIFRGVLASLLPQKREKIRRVLTFHLISRLNEDDDDGLLLPNIIEQLLQLDGEKSLKANYLFRGFVAAAEARKSAEAFYYKRLLDDLDRDYCTTLPLTVRMRDCRLRAILHYQNGEADKAVAAAAELFNLTSASFKVRSNTTLGFLISLYRHLRVLSSIQQSPSAGEIASRYLLETFPFAFPAPEKGAEPKKGRSRKTVHPLHDASSMKDALERLGEIVLVLDMLCEMFIVGEREGPDLILYQMSLVVLASFGKFASTGTDQRYWSWRLRLGWSGLGMSWYLIGRSSQGKRCIDAALASIPLENADSESPPLTPLELLCKGTCCTIESALDRMRNETICMSAVLMLRAACDHYRAAGAEFEVACKGSQLTLQWMLVMMGSFSLPTEHGDLYRMDEVLKRAEKYSFDGRYVMQLKSAVAFETSMRGDFSRAEEYVRLCSVAGFNLIEDLGLEEVNVLTVLAIMVNVTCLSMLLVERGRVLSISVGVFNRFVDSYDTAQAATAPTLKSLLIQGTVLCAITLLTEAKKGLLAFIVSCRKFAASCSPRSFQTTCCKGLAGVASQVLRGDLSRAEMALARLLGTAGAQDMIPAHMRLMLEARLVRLRYIRAARGETGLTVASVAAAAKELCARFQSFDNRCDPERLQAVCV